MNWGTGFISLTEQQQYVNHLVEEIDSFVQEFKDPLINIHTLDIQSAKFEYTLLIIPLLRLSVLSQQKSSTTKNFSTNNQLLLMTYPRSDELSTPNNQDEKTINAITPKSML